MRAAACDRSMKEMNIGTLGGMGRADWFVYSLVNFHKKAVYSSFFSVNTYNVPPVHFQPTYEVTLQTHLYKRFNTILLIRLSSEQPPK